MPAELMIERKRPPHCFSLGREREEKNDHLVFQVEGLPKGLASVWPDSKHYFGCVGAAENKAELVSCGSAREPTIPQTDSRRGKRPLHPPEKETQNWGEEEAGLHT